MKPRSAAMCVLVLAMAWLATSPSLSLAFPPAGEPASPSAFPRATAPPARWVAVSVATVWVKPGQKRRVDAPALAAPADPRRWVTSMTVAQKLWLNGRVETQALYGTKVYLLGTSGSWSHVAVAGQPTPRNRWGYPGWIPTRQLTRTRPSVGGATAVIRRRTAWLWDTAALSERLIELSYGTKLPVVRSTSIAVEVLMIGGRHAFVRRAAVALHCTGEAWPRPTGRQAVAQARILTGLWYLYGGTSGYGFDCSGFTHSVLRALGVTIPRDAQPQAARGRNVTSRAALRAGDLVFFQDPTGYIHHVGMYVGGGKMIHSPSTGERIQLSSIWVEPYLSEYAGARRYLSAP